MNEEKIEETIEKEVKKRVQKELEKQSEEAEKTAKEDEKLSRRSFLKNIGLGAGIIGLSSFTSAWSVFQPSNQGTSDIDANSVRGSRIFVQSTEPSSPTEDDIWFDTS